MSDTGEYSRIKQDSLTIYLKTSRCSVYLFSAVSENALATTVDTTINPHHIISLLRRHFYSLPHVTHVSSRNQAIFIMSGPEKASLRSCPLPKPSPYYPFMSLFPSRAKEAEKK